MIEFCRQCCDNSGEIVPADFILWGKFVAPEHLGPRCYAHASDALPGAMSMIDQYAVFDLRPYQRSAMNRSDRNQAVEPHG